jgi:hypothetical protein
MSSAFNLLTAGGATFDKKRFKADHDLFAKVRHVTFTLTASAAYHTIPQSDH